MNDARRDAERKHLALRRLAQLYGAHGDSRSALVAVHAATWADLAAATWADPAFDEAAVRQLAADDASADTYEGYTGEDWQNLWRYFIDQVIDRSAAGVWLSTVGSVVPITGIPAPHPAGKPGTPFGEPDETVEGALVRLADECTILTNRLFDDVLQGHVHDAERDSESADAAAFQRYLLERSLARGDSENVQAEILWALASAAQHSSKPAGGDVRSRIIQRRATWAWALPSNEHGAVLAAFPRNPLL